MNGVRVRGDIVVHALTADGQMVAQELYVLLRKLDPARLRRDMEAEIRAQIRRIQSGLQRILLATDQFGEHLNQRLVEPLRERLRELLFLIEERLPLPGADGFRQDWEALRQAMTPAYERLAVALGSFDIHVPPLRPTNYARNAYHAANGLGVLLLIELILPASWMVWVAAAFTALAWSLETSRRVVPQINRFCMWVFGKLAHPHEAWRVNSATWFVSALLLVASLGDKSLAALAVVVLGFADPAAAIIGRRFGRRRLINGRSLEGTLTFIFIGSVAGLCTLAVFHPEIAITHAAILALTGATAGALAELVSRRVDDNFTIPVSVALAALCVRVALGI
jgi:dolichol kinase